MITFYVLVGILLANPQDVRPVKAFANGDECEANKAYLTETISSKFENGKVPFKFACVEMKGKVE